MKIKIDKEFKFYKYTGFYWHQSTKLPIISINLEVILLKNFNYYTL